LRCDEGENATMFPPRQHDEGVATDNIVGEAVGALTRLRSATSFKTSLRSVS